MFKDNQESSKIYNQLKQLYRVLAEYFKHTHNRLLPLNEMIVDRWEKAKLVNAGENTNIYDSCIIIGEVKIGKECWIGPNTLLDGSGMLVIGDYCTVSAGVQIYTHDNVKQTLTSKKALIEREGVIIGSNVYIAPNAVITKGVNIGNHVVIGTFAFVNKSIPDGCIVMGQPAKIVGKVENTQGEIRFSYEKNDR